MKIKTKRDLEIEVDGRRMTLFAGVILPAKKKMRGWYILEPFNLFVDPADVEELPEDA